MKNRLYRPPASWTGGWRTESLVLKLQKRWAGNGLVNIPASWSPEGTKQTKSWRRAAPSLIKFWSISIWLVRAWNTRLVARKIALTLSHNNRGVEDKEKFSSVNKDCTQINSLAADAHFSCYCKYTGTGQVII